MFKLSDFDYELPKELIAQEPLKKRDESRLLVLDRVSGRIEHRIFKDMVEYLHKDDLLVLNNTKVVPARLLGRKETGGKVEVLILYNNKVSTNNGEYEALLKPSRGNRIGSKLSFDNGRLKAEITRIDGGRRFLKFNTIKQVDKVLDEFGQMPLPPYISRDAGDLDKLSYQTVYASKKGAIAAPTAGLHFTKDILGRIKEKGADIEFVTLHVGYGTFKPVRSLDIRGHRMEKEHFSLEKDAIKKIENKKGRLVAVGTTTCRVLEAMEQGFYSGWTDLFIYPSYKFKRVDALLTNFHLPKTTLLMLVAAFCNRRFLFKAYEEAIREKYRFYSYGDAMLII